MNTANLDERIENLKFIKEEYGCLSNHRQNELNEYISIKEQLTLTDVSQQRELLNGFRDWLIDERKNIHFYRHLIDDYLKTI